MSTLLLAPVLLLAANAAPARQQPTPDFRADVHELWRLVDEVYAYRDELEDTWLDAREEALAEAERCTDRWQLLPVLERALAHLADHHSHLGANGPNSPALVPSGTDLWAEWIDGRATITSVRGGSAAEAAGVRAGMRALTIDGAELDDAIEGVAGRARTALDARQADWALRSVLAGQRGAPRRLTVETESGLRELELGPASGSAPPNTGIDTGIDARRLGDDLGYVRLANSLGDLDCVAAFDAALAELRDTRGLVLDLRDTPGGGNTTVARGLLGRFVDRERPYQRHELPNEEARFGIRRAWLELVAPRGPFRYDRPVVVLVGRWTASMGEGLALGFDALGAPVVGGPMAGLRGAIESFTLPVSGFPVRLPTERLSHVDGRPRESFRGVDVEPSPSDGDSDAVLEAGLELLEEALAR